MREQTNNKKDCGLSQVLWRKQKGAAEKNGNLLVSFRERLSENVTFSLSFSLIIWKLSGNQREHSSEPLCGNHQASTICHSYSDAILK